MTRAIGEPGGAYPPEFRAEVVDYAQENGITAAAREKGVSKPSVAAWLKAAGIDPSSVAFKNLNKQQMANAASLASRKARADAIRESASVGFLNTSVQALEKLNRFLTNDIVDNITLYATLPPGTRVVDLATIAEKMMKAHMMVEAKNGGNVEERPSRERMLQMRDELSERRQARETQLQAESQIQ